MKPTTENKKLSLFWCILLPILLLLLSYNAVLFFIPVTVAQENVFHFLAGKEELSSGFTSLEITHLQDVKQVMKYADYLFYFTLLIITGLVIYYRKNKEFLFKLFESGGKVTVLAMIIIGGLAVLFFDSVFTLFHRIFFPQGNWQFAIDSKIIQTFPLDFFVMVSRNIFLLSLFFGMIFILLGYYFKYVHDKRS